jgi:hypothetical protein
MFVRSSDWNLWHIWQRSPNGGWSGWESLGGTMLSNPVVGRNFGGRLEVFARGTDYKVHHIWQTARNNGWSGWTGSATGPSAI